MMHSSQIRRTLVPLLVLALLSPTSLYGAVPEGPNVAPADLALAPGGELRGQVLDHNGQPRTDCTVQVSYQNQCIASVRTGSQGEYRVTGLRGGLHSIATPEGATLCRLWAPGSAPPHAAEQLLLVRGDTVVRGNRSGRYAMAGILSNPWLLIAAGTVAIAVPVALNGNGTSGRSGS